MYAASVKTPVGELFISSSGKGVTAVGASPLEGEPGDPFGAAKQIGEYMCGKRKTFDLPLDIRGTEFQLGVWRAAQGIPYGNTATYKEIARSLSRPGAARAVGSALGRNPVPVIIPCHRVVSPSGLAGYALGPGVKRKLLLLEGADI